MHSKLCYPLAAGLLAVALSPVSAQSVTTEPVGAMTYEFAANSTTSVGIPLLRPAAYSGVVNSGDANTVTFAAGVDFSNLLSAGEFYYIEVTGSDNAQEYIGDRLEVDEAASIVAGSNVLHLDLGSNLNTTSGDLGALTGYRITIRPHWTIAKLFGTGLDVTDLTSATTFAYADRILAWGGVGWSTYWFRQNSAGTTKEWRNTATGTANQDDAIIPPGVGLYLRKAGLPKTMVVTGDVRTNRFIRTLDHSTQLIALGHPIDLTPTQMGLLPIANFTPATAFAYADRVLAWGGVGYSTYWLRRNSAGDVIQWRNTSTGTVDHSNSAFILADQAFFIMPVGTPDDLTVSLPFGL